MKMAYEAPIILMLTLQSEEIMDKSRESKDIIVDVEGFFG